MGGGTWHRGSRSSSSSSSSTLNILCTDVINEKGSTYGTLGDHLVTSKSKIHWQDSCLVCLRWIKALNLKFEIKVPCVVHSNAQLCCFTTKININLFHPLSNFFKKDQSRVSALFSKVFEQLERLDSSLEWWLGIETITAQLKIRKVSCRKQFTHDTIHTCILERW